jgi:hypothetical protein
MFDTPPRGLLQLLLPTGLDRASSSHEQRCRGPRRIPSSDRVTTAITNPCLSTTTSECSVTGQKSARRRPDLTPLTISLLHGWLHRLRADRRIGSSVPRIAIFSCTNPKFNFKLITIHQLFFLRNRRGGPY